MRKDIDDQESEEVTMFKAWKKDVIWKGFDVFRQFLKPIGELKQDPVNARKHSERNIAVVTTSLNDMGQHRLAIMQDDGTVQIGGAMLTAAEGLGWTHLAAVRSGDKGDRIRLRGLIDNRSGDPEVGSEWDFPNLADLLENLDTGEIDLATIGWDEKEIEDIMTWDGPKIPPEEPGGTGDGVKSIRVTLEQRVTINKAIELVRKEKDDPKMKEGRAVELIAAGFIAEQPTE